MRLVVVLFDRIGLGFGLGDGLLRPAFKISTDDCCSRLKCGGCVVVWGSVEGVVSSCATGVTSVEVDFVVRYIICISITIKIFIYFLSNYRADTVDGYNCFMVKLLFRNKQFKSPNTPTLIRIPATVPHRTVPYGTVQIFTRKK